MCKRGFARARHELHLHPEDAEYGGSRGWRIHRHMAGERQYILGMGEG